MTTPNIVDESTFLFAVTLYSSYAYPLQAVGFWQFHGFPKSVSGRLTTALVDYSM